MKWIRKGLKVSVFCIALVVWFFPQCLWYSIGMCLGKYDIILWDTYRIRGFTSQNYRAELERYWQNSDGPAQLEAMAKAFAEDVNEAYQNRSQTRSHPNNN